MGLFFLSGKRFFFFVHELRDPSKSLHSVIKNGIKRKKKERFSVIFEKSTESRASHVRKKILHPGKIP